MFPQGSDISAVAMARSSYEFRKSSNTVGTLLELFSAALEALGCAKGRRLYHF
jgi:hypothetical protein